MCQHMLDRLRLIFLKFVQNNEGRFTIMGFGCTTARPAQYGMVFFLGGGGGERLWDICST